MVRDNPEWQRTTKRGELSQRPKMMAKLTVNRTGPPTNIETPLKWSVDTCLHTSANLKIHPIEKKLLMPEVKVLKWQKLHFLVRLFLQKGNEILPTFQRHCKKVSSSILGLVFSILAVRTPYLKQFESERKHLLIMVQRPQINYYSGICINSFPN